MIQHDPLRKKVAQFISSQPELSHLNQEIYKSLVDAPKIELGHLSLGCFIIGKSLKKSPAQVAIEIAEVIGLQIQSKNEISHYILQAQASGPYLNLKFTSLAFNELVLKPLLYGQTFKARLTEITPKTMIEYSQPNTHKELHVGHMRNMCLGDALVRSLRYVGYEVISSTFPGDVGTHVAKCLWYLKHHNTEPVPMTNKGEWLGRMYSLGNLKLEDEAATEKFETNKKELTLILKQLEAGQGEYFDLWRETRQWSIDLMKEIYQWAGVEFDHWYFESDVDADSVRTIKKFYDQGKLMESQGAIGLDLDTPEHGQLGFCLLLKSDGTGLYATKDIELARRKFENYKIEKSIYVVDQRQALHFKQVFKSLELLGFEQAKNCFHLQYNFVELPDGAMSSRKGNIVPLTLLVNTMKDHIKIQYLKRYESEWPLKEIEQTADQVAQGAIKYGMLKQDTNKKIVFDMNEWIKLDGDSGPFIQYSYARINSLLKKVDIKEKIEINDLNAHQVYTHVSEIILIQHLMNFNTVVLNAAENYKPALICAYLYDTAKKFNGFYHECSINQAETELLKTSRLELAKATGLILKNGLALLGIPVPERM